MDVEKGERRCRVVIAALLDFLAPVVGEDYLRGVVARIARDVKRDLDELSEPLVHRLEHRPLDEGVEPNSPDRVDLRPVELRFPIHVICHLVLPFFCAETTVVSTLHMMP